MVGVNSKKGCFGRKTKFFWESEDFAGKFSGRNKVIKFNFRDVLDFFGECRPKFCDDIPDFREDFY